MTNEPGTRRGRRWLRVLGVIVILALVLVAAAPSLVSWTFGPSLVAGAIEGSVNGDVQIASVRFGWTSPQQISGLVIDDKANGNLIRADATVKRSLFSLITNPMGELEVIARADVTTAQTKDGELTIARIVKPSTAPAPTTKQQLPRSLVLSVQLDPSSVTVVPAAGDAVSVSGLSGTLRFAAADGSVKSNLACTVRSGPAASLSGAGTGPGGGGTVTVATDLKGVVDAYGAPTIGAAVGTAKVGAKSIKLDVGGRKIDLATLDVSVDATNASQAIAATYAISGASVAAPGATATDPPVVAEIVELAGSATLGRDPKGAMGLSSSDLTALIERGSVAVRSSGDPFTATNIHANVALGAGGRASFKVAAQTAIGSRAGSVAGEGALEHLFNEKFEIEPGRATGTAQLTVQKAVVPSGKVLMEIDTLTASIDASSASAPIRVVVDGVGNARAVGAENAAAGPAASPATLRAAVSLARDASPQNRLGISTDPSAIVADVEAKSVPSAILRPFIPAIGELDIDPVRDLGPTIDLTAKSTPGTTTPLALSIRSARVSAAIQAAVDPTTGSLRDGQGSISATLAPELLASAKVTSNGPVKATITIAQLVIPRMDDRVLLDGAAGNVSVEIDGAILRPIAGTEPSAISQIRASLQTKRVADGVTMSTSVVVDGVPAHVNADVTGLGGVGTDAFRIDSIRAKGQASAGPVQWGQPPAFLREQAPKVLRYGLTQSTLGLGFDGGRPAGAALVRATDGQQSFTTNVSWTPERVRIEQTAVNAIVSNALLDGLDVKTVRLAQPATLEITAEPIEIARAQLEQGGAGTAARTGPNTMGIRTATVSVRSTAIMVAEAPGVAQPITLGNLQVTAKADLEKSTIDASGTTTLADASASLAELALSFTLRDYAAETRSWSASVDGRNVDGSRLLRTAGVDPAKVPGVAGSTGGTLALKATQAPNKELAADFDVALGAVKGKGAALLRPDQSIAIANTDLSITLDAARATSFFATEKDAQGRQLITRASAWPIAVSLHDIAIPAPDSDGTRDWERTKGDATLTTGNLDLDVIGVGTARIGGVEGKLLLGGEGRSLDLQANSTLTTPQTGTQPLSVKLRVIDFANASGDFDWEKLALDGEAKLAGLPVAVLDVFVDGDGSLAEMLGPQLAADIRAVSPRGDPGSSITGTVKSEYLAMDLGRIDLEDESILIAKDAPLSAALIPNKTLRERLLKPINPILADIRPQEGHPIVFAVDELDVPVDMDLKRLDSHFTLTIGDVELERNSRILSLMRLVREDADGVIPGNISPLNGTIVDGRLSYDDFTVSIGKIGETWNQQLYLSGDVDLGSTPMYARAISVDYPVAGFGRLAAGATRFDAFFGRINEVISKLPMVDSNALRVRATFSGPIEPGKDLDMAMEPVLVTPPGTNPVSGVIDGIFGDKGILKIPGLGGSQGGGSGSGGGATGGATGGGSGTGSGAGGDQKDGKIGDLFKDIFKKKKKE